MISFFVGKAYCDISAMLRERMIKRLCEDESAKLIYIVPDQFEYETENAVFQALDEKGMTSEFSRIRTVTFSHLAAEIIAASGNDKKPADDIMKSIIMHKVIGINKERLLAFRNIADKRGFCDKMISTVSMLKTAGITPDMLNEESIEKQLALAEEKHTAKSLRRDSVIERKLRDVGMIFYEYNTALGDKYLDRLDYCSVAADIVAGGTVDAFDGADVYIDRFNDFTNGQFRFIKEIFIYAENVVLGFNTDMQTSDETRASAFITINSQIDRMKDYIEHDEKCCELSYEMIYAQENTRAQHKALCELSEKLFGVGGADAVADGAIDIVQAADIYDELDFTAAKIKQLALENDIRYKDIAVLLADPAAYKGALESAFSKYDIPFFMDIHNSILHQPLITLVTSILNVLTNNFSINSVLSYVKTGFLHKKTDDGEITPLTKTDINAFETYIYEWTVTPEMIRKPFTAFDADDRHSQVMTERAEITRNAVIPPLLKLQKALAKEHDGAGITKVLYNFIKKDIDIERGINARVNSRLNADDKKLTRSYQSLWNMLRDIMDRLFSGLKDVPVSLGDHAEMFCDICAGTALAKPPQYIDTVLVGDIDRTRAGNVKAVFILGATDESLPSPAAADGVFSQFETEVIRENIINISENTRRDFGLKSAKEQYALSQYRAFKALSLPEKYLCMSYPAANLQGGENRRSEIIDNILMIFPDIKITDTAEIDAAFFARTLKAAKQMYAAGLYQDSEQHASLEQALLDNGQKEFVDTLCALKEKRSLTEEQNISPEAAELLFSKNISATKVEKISLCKFKYFCENGLRITEPVVRTFNPIFRGNAVHYCLEKILYCYAGRMDEFFKLTRAQLQTLSVNYLKEYSTAHFAENFADDKRTEYLFANLAVITTDILIMLQAEFFGRSYRPKFFELNLKECGELPIIDSSEKQSALASAELFCDENENTQITLTDEKPTQSEKTLNVSPLKISLQNGENVSITGIVDRVDMFTDEKDNQYMRVVDYKTNTHIFSIPKALSGVNVQMLLYLFALSEANAQGDSMIIPGGISYLPVKPDGSLGKRTSAYAFLANQHKQKGMIVATDEIYGEAKQFADGLANAVMEDYERALKIAEAKGTEPPQLPDWIKKKVGKDDFFKLFMPEENNTLSAQGFDNFRSDCLDSISRNLNNLFAGSVSAIPTNYKESGMVSPCGYCHFASVCGNRGDAVVVDEKMDISKYVVPTEKKKKSGKKEE